MWHLFVCHLNNSKSANWMKWNGMEWKWCSSLWAMDGKIRCVKSFPFDHLCVCVCGEILFSTKRKIKSIKIELYVMMEHSVSFGTDLFDNIRLLRLFAFVVIIFFSSRPFDDTIYFVVCALCIQNLVVQFPPVLYASRLYIISIVIYFILFGWQFGCDNSNSQRFLFILICFFFQEWEKRERRRVIGWFSVWSQKEQKENLYLRNSMKILNAIRFTWRDHPFDVF